MPTLELLVLQFGERHWDAFWNVDGYARSLTRARDVQHDFNSRGLQRRTLSSETFAQLILLERHGTATDATFIPNAILQTWRHNGLYRVRVLERPAPDDAFARIPTEMKARSFRSISNLRVSTKPEALEEVLELFKDAAKLLA